MGWSTTRRTVSASACWYDLSIVCSSRQPPAAATSLTGSHADLIVVIQALSWRVNLAAAGDPPEPTSGGGGGVVAEKDPLFLRTRLTRKANLVLAALRLSDSVAKLHHAEAPFPIPADTEIITPVV